jgi:hypothetical protein
VGRVRVSRPVPRRALAAASIVVASAVVPATAAAAPEVVGTPTVAGPPALVAWTAGRSVSVAGADGVGRRAVARLTARFDPQADLVLSRDGRRLAVVTGSSVKVADLIIGGPLRTLDRGGDHDIVRWSPAGDRLLLVGGTIRLCDVASQTPCRRVARNTADEYGATWSPDGTQFAYVRSSPVAAETGSNVGDVVRQDAAGRVHVLERSVLRGTRRTSPVSPVWTARGLAWSSWTERVVNEGVTRTATRLLTADGRVRTITAADAAGASAVPFTLASDSPSGDLIGLQYREPGGVASGRSSLRLMRLSPFGAVRPWGLSLVVDAGNLSTTVDDYLGTLADGRVAVARGTMRGDVQTTTVRLVAPGRPLGPVLAEGSSVAIASAYPNEAIDF